MQKKHYKFDSSGVYAPNAGVPMHQHYDAKEKKNISDGIGAQKLSQVMQKPAKEHGVKDTLLGNGKILGKYEPDDIILLCIIFLLFQNKDEVDLPLLLALGYIFLSDKDLTFLLDKKF